NLWLDTPELIAAHATIVADAKAPNDLIDSLTNLQGCVFGDEERVSIAGVRAHLRITETDAHRDQRLASRITDAMTPLGWETPSGSMRCSRLGEHLANPEKGFRRPIVQDEALRRRQLVGLYTTD